MNELEIVFENVEKNSLDNLIFKGLKLNEENIITSHFYSQGKDVEYSDLLSLKNYFESPGTGNMFMKRIDVGVILSDVMMIISFDEVYGNIVLNFNITQILSGTESEKLQKCADIIKRIKQLYSSIESDKIILGYEPATDSDMEILNVDEKGLHIMENSNSEIALIAKGVVEIF